MKKKLITLLLASSMLVGLLAGCGGKNAEQTTTDALTTAGQTDTQAGIDAVTTAAVTTAAITEEATTAEPETTGEPVTYEVIERNGYVNTFDITDYGAVGDGVTDCTAAVQAALDDAGRVEGTVIVPPGKYKVGQLKMHPHVRLEGDSAWSFDEDGGSVFLLNDPNATCMIDITGAFGCTITGMSLNGQYKGEGVHGVYLNWPEYNGGGNEDTPTVEDCRIGYFTGDGVHLSHVWCFSVRHNMICFNNGSGLYIDGWDGFILDNWFSANSNCGIYADQAGTSLSITGNRIEVNSVAGIWIRKGDLITVTGNYFDASHGPGLKLGGGSNVSGFTVTGNFFRRSGGPDKNTFEDEYENCHLFIKGATNGAVSGNTFAYGNDDSGMGPMQPYIGIYVSNSKGVVVQSNSLFQGAVEKCIVSRRNVNVLVKDNITDLEQEVTDK